MAKFKVKQPIVEANKYEEGARFEGIDAHLPKVIYSRDRKLFYVTGTDAEHWLSIEKAENGKHTAYSFNMYDFHANKNHEEITTKDNEMALLYCDVFGVEYPIEVAFCETGNGTVKLQSGDYVVLENGIYSAYTEQQFFSIYEPIED